MMGYVILGITGNREDSLGRHTHKLTEYIAAIFLLISTSAHTGADQDVIHDDKDDYDDDVSMYDINESKSGYQVDK